MVAYEKEQIVEKKKEFYRVDISYLTLSGLNPRDTRPEDDIDRLAERMRRNGFEPTRALWVRPGPTPQQYEVFAGGTRLLAARKTEIKSIPCMVHSGFDDEEIVRLADEDNENDEYHAPVPLTDQWAAVYRLWNEGNGWDQKRIALAKGWQQPKVSLYCQLHRKMPESVRSAVYDGLLGDGQCQALLGLTYDVIYLHPWLAPDQARDELAKYVVDVARGKSDGKADIKVENIRKKVEQWLKLIADADDGYHQLNEEWGPRFVEKLASEKVRTLAKLNECFQLILREKHEAEKKKAAEADKAKSEAEQAAAEAERQAEEAARIEEMTAKIVHGDALESIVQMPEASLLLTDPPYGQDFQSGRRKSTGKKKKIEADDDPAEAAELLRGVLAAARDRLKDNAHVLVFSGWRHEPIFRHAVASAGYEIKGSLVWVKNNHGTGDLKGSFAPKHERIIHAVKGKPEMAKRIPDVVDGKDKQNSDHPTEKPIELLKKLIEATTHKLDVVVDPFAGSGSTLFAALDLDRDFWGVEIDESYHKKIQDELYRRATEK